MTNTRTAEKFKAVEADLSSAIEFAFGLPTMMVHLTAIHPTTTRILGQSFNKTASGKAAALKWIAGAAKGGYGVYFNFNEVSPRLDLRHVKAKETEISTVYALHVDVDPPEGTPAKMLPAVREKMLVKIKAAEPSLVINSGNGYGVFFAIDPVTVTDANRDSIKARNIELAERLGGDDCEDLCRVMRLPFTVNIPNAKKAKAGRVPVLASVVSDDRDFTAYKLDDFEAADVSIDDPSRAEKPDSADKSSGTAYAKIGSPEIPETVDLARLDDALRDLIVSGVPDGEDRSAAVYGVACDLRRDNWSDGDILAVLTDRSYSISDHIFDQTQREPEEQASRVIMDMDSRGVVREKDAKQEFDADDEDDLTASTPKRELPKALSLTELMNGTFLRTPYTVGDLVMQGIVNMFYGNGGTGKTTIAIQMAVAVAAGRRLFERDTIKGPSLLVLAEDGPGDIKPRVENAIKDLEIENPGELDCEVWPLPGEDISVARINEEGKTVLLPFYYELEKKLAAKPGLFVVLDSLVDIAQMGEAARLPVNTFFKKVLGGLAVKYKATILVLGHPSKASMADNSYFSGSTAYRNAVRNMIVIKEIKDNATFRSLERLKNNYADPKQSIVVAWSNDIFVTTRNAVVADAEQGRYMAVLNTIREMIDKGLDVANVNQAKGQTPREVAKAVNALGVVSVTSRDVISFMRQAERTLDLKYVKATNRRGAHFEIGKPADLINTDDEDTLPAVNMSEAEQEFETEEGDDNEQ